MDAWNVVRGAGKATRTADRMYENRPGAFSRPPYQRYNQGGSQYYGRRPVNRGGYYQAGWRDHQNWRQEVPAYHRGGPGREGNGASGQVHQPIPRTGPVQPSKELGEIMSMIKAMQASIASLEGKQLPLTREARPDMRPSGAAASQPMDRPGPGKQVSNFSVANLLPTGVNSNNVNVKPTVTINRNRNLPVNNLPPSSIRRGPQTGAEMSANPDFAGLCKSMFRLVQLKHHQGNWKTLPKGISRNIERTIRNIKPPMPCNELSDHLLALSLEFQEKLSKAVSDHITTAYDKVLSEQGHLNNSDVRSE